MRRSLLATHCMRKSLRYTHVKRRTVELFSIAQPLLANFFCSLVVSVSLTMDGWSNRNLKGFYVITVHWIDMSSGEMKNLLLTILDVSSGTGVGNRVGSALFSYLTDMMGAAFLPRLLHIVTDNGSDACASVNRLFQLVNSHLGSRVLLPSNHIRCADHSVQRGVLLMLAQVKEINEDLWGALVTIRRSKVLIVWRQHDLDMQVRSPPIRIAPLGGTRRIRCAAMLWQSARHWTKQWCYMRMILEGGH